MKTFNVKIVGLTPLMHHRMTEEAIMKLLGAKETKKQVKIYKTPREIAQEHAYQMKDGTCFIPAGYIAGAFINTSSDFKRTDNSKKSLKSIAGGIFRVLERDVVLKDAKGKVLKDYEIDIQKATNHKVGAVAVCRPRFDDWTAQFNVTVDDSMISPSLAQQILEESGRRVGIGSFRVSKCGFYGQFKIEHFKEVKA